ncbi:phosphopantetheine-binding protein [Plantactinospora sp. WMMB782]|uniref:phosphopantetheine-binding protein n=1 Tax=Plantactinospora sp. WMMB782 TaxID=3404121 RepID=UPI003B93C273
MTGDVLRRELASLVEAATDGEVPASQALRAEETLNALGVSSLGFLRLIDAIEARFGVEFDIGTQPGTLDSVDAIAVALRARGAHLDDE